MLLCSFEMNFFGGKCFVLVFISSSKNGQIVFPTIYNFCLLNVFKSFICVDLGLAEFGLVCEVIAIAFLLSTKHMSLVLM